MKLYQIIFEVRGNVDRQTWKVTDLSAATPSIYRG